MSQDSYEIWKDRLRHDRGRWGGIGTIFPDEETGQ